MTGPWDPPPAGLDRHPGPPRRHSAAPPCAAAIVLAAFGFLLTSFMTVLRGLSADIRCSYGADLGVCDPAVETASYVVGIGGLALGVAVCVAGIVAARRDRPPAPWILAGGAVYVLATVVAHALGSPA